MKITFISNYINHHQIPFSDALYEKLGEDFTFIQTMPMERERLAMGWEEEGRKRPYVRCLYEEERLCRRLIMESEILLAGWSEREDLVGERLKAGKITVRVSERLYREGRFKAISPRGLVQKYKDHVRYRQAPVYLLCSGAYTAGDFKLIGAYPGKMYKWGYFPPVYYYTEEERAQLKYEGSRVHIVWAARMIPLKHPEFPIQMMRDLKQEGYEVHLHMIGDGELRGEIESLAGKYLLSGEEITFYGSLSPDQVRKVMEKCHIQLFTSNYLEGWGAVLNEGMNSCCCVVANVQAGAAPYLIEHGRNGMVYCDGRYESMLKTMRYVLKHGEERKRMGEQAYRTITTRWNGVHAAREFLRFSEGLLEGRAVPAKEGPLSPASSLSLKHAYKKMIRMSPEGGRQEFM